MTGDGRADIVGFGGAGVYVAHVTGSGEFGPMTRLLDVFGAGPGAGSWTSDDSYPRELADVTGDGTADIVGFGIAGVYLALSADPFAV